MTKRKRQESDVQVTELSYDAPIGVTVPTFKPKGNKDHIPYSGQGGKLDNFPNELEELRNRCTFHNRILINKALQIAGEGFVCTEEDEVLKQRTIDFLEKVNEEEEDMNELMSQWADDLVTFGGFCAEVIWSKDWNRIVAIHNVPFKNIRIGTYDEKGKIKEFLFSFDWTDSRQPREVILPFSKGNKEAYKKASDTSNKSTYNINTVRSINQEGRAQLFYYKPKKWFYYPLPDYIPALTAIEADINADVENKKAMTNGFKAGMSVTFSGITDVTKRNNNTKTLMKNALGAKNSGNILPFYVERPEEAPQFNEFTGSRNAAEAKITTDQNIQKILSVHGVTSPLLVGLTVPGSLGNGSDFPIAQEAFYKNVIRPEQFVIAKFVNKIMKINELGKVSIERLIITLDTDANERDKEVNNEIGD